jgi:RNA polymerase subunit RPABC4/transcription elongation factor Spt4
MAFCANCGIKLEEGVKFCSGCGTPIISAGVEIRQDKAVNIIQAQPAVLPVSQNQNIISADEKYCFSCGSIIKKAAEICPRCGVNQSKRNATTAIEVYCTSCGKTIKKEAAVCPFCGVQHIEGLQSSAKDKKRQAIVSLVLGLIGLIAWFIPLLGFPVAIIGLIMGIVGQKSTKKSMATAGLILSIISLVATIINSAIGAYQGATGTHPLFY